MPLYIDVLGWKKVYIVYLYAYWAKIRRTLVFTNYQYVKLEILFVNSNALSFRLAEILFIS